MQRIRWVYTVTLKNGTQFCDPGEFRRCGAGSESVTRPERGSHRQRQAAEGAGQREGHSTE